MQRQRIHDADTPVRVNLSSQHGESGQHPLITADELWMLHSYQQSHQFRVSPIYSDNVLPEWFVNLANMPPAELARVVCLSFAGAFWLAGMAIPAGGNIHPNIEDVPYLLIGLVLWAGAQVAHWLNANIRFYWFFSVLLILANWF